MTSSDGGEPLARRRAPRDCRRLRREYLELPERVILEVARGHQRYFGMRSADGKLLPSYLSVANTANNPANVRRGNDRAMRARLADARFFYTEDLKLPLANRREKLAQIVFQKRLGTVLAKSDRVERLARELGLLAMLPEPTIMAAAWARTSPSAISHRSWSASSPSSRARWAAPTPSLRVWPLKSPRSSGHYMPRGASGGTATTDPAALVAIADRLDTLVGCFGINLTPTGAADPYGLRRACLGVLRTLMDWAFDLSLVEAFKAAYAGFTETKLDLTCEELTTKLGEFFAERLRGLLETTFPSDVVAACLAVAADRPLDAKARAAAIVTLDKDQRSGVGEVFKRATNIAGQAPPGSRSLPPPTRIRASAPCSTPSWPVARPYGSSFNNAITAARSPR